nr:putative ribonuclease H-like domain-containing protein [Tanacetum cinerariifolium]
EEPKKIFDTLKDPSWVEAMHEELLQFKIQNVLILVDCPKGMDVKSAFLYGTIDEEVYVMQPPGFQDLEFPDRVYKVEKAMYGLHQAPRAWYGTLSIYLLDNSFQKGTIDQTLFIRKHRGDFLLVQVYVDEIIFGSSNLQLCREFEALMHDKFQMSAIGKLTFFLGLPDIMFVVCACARQQVTPKECHLYAVKRIFRYLKGHPILGLWYPKESLFDLVAYSDSDYGGATQDRKSTTRGCQFLGRRLISWQCIKQTIVATSTTEAEYVAAASGCGQVLWIQNQMLDYGYNFMNTKIYIDNNSAICIVKNPVYHSKTKHIEIRHYFIKDCYEKKLINVDHIHTDDNVVDLLTKHFDVGRFQYLVTVPLFATMLVTQGEGSATPTEPHHTPSPQEQHSSHHDTLLPSHPITTTELIPQPPTKTLTETPTLRQYSRKATQIAQSKALSSAADEPAYHLRDDIQREAFLTVTSLDAGQDKENIIKTSAFPYKSTPRVTSLDADKGSMQQQLQELMDLYTSLQRQQTQMAAKIKDQDLEISSLKARVKILEDKERGRVEPAQEDAPIKGGMVNVLSFMKAANILTSGVPTVSVSLVAAATTVDVPTVSGLFPTISATFTTASVVTPYSIRSRGISIKDKGTEKVVESEVPKKRKLKEHIDAQVAKEMEEDFARENQRLNEQLTRDSKIARLYAEEELKMMIECLDKRNEVIAKHLQEYEQAAVELTIGEKIKLINELEQREFYMSLPRSHVGWKTKHFRGMTLDKIKEKFIPIWKQLEDFVPMSSTEEGERMKRKGLKLDQGSAKRMKTSEDVSEEDLKGMMQLVPVEEVYVEALQVKHPIIDWEIHYEGKKDY